MTLMTSTLTEQIPAIMIMLGIFCSIGCIGNTIVIVIYSTKHDRLTSTVFILALAMVDSFACVCLMPLTIYIESVEWRIQSEFLCKFYYVINNSFIPFSSLLISGIAFDRYFAICHPFSKIITVSRAKQIIIVMLSLALLLGGVSSMTIVVKLIPTGNTSAPEYECTETRMLNTTETQMAIYHIVQGSQISSYVLCILSVVILYVLIFRSVLIVRFAPFISYALWTPKSSKRKCIIYRIESPKILFGVDVVRHYLNFIFRHNSPKSYKVALQGKFHLIQFSKVAFLLY